MLTHHVCTVMPTEHSPNQSVWNSFDPLINEHWIACFIHCNLCARRNLWIYCVCTGTHHTLSRTVKLVKHYHLLLLSPMLYDFGCYHAWCQYRGIYECVCVCVTMRWFKSYPQRRNGIRYQRQINSLSTQSSLGWENYACFPIYTSDEYTWKLKMTNTWCFHLVNLCLLKNVRIGAKCDALINL